MLSALIAADERGYLALHGFAATHPVVKELAIFFAHDAIFLLALYAGLCVAWGLRGVVRASPSQESAKVRVRAFVGGIAAYAAGAAAWCANNVFGWIVFRPRPFVTLAGQAHPLVAVDAASKSLPSDHAGIAFAVAWVLARSWPASAPYVLPGAALIALGRVAAGVHYPTDVVAGAAVGIVAGEIVWSAVRHSHLIERLCQKMTPPSFPPRDSSA
jgi:undecaprenyl-diphosphatase